MATTVQKTTSQDEHYGMCKIEKYLVRGTRGGGSFMTNKNNVSGFHQRNEKTDILMADSSCTMY